MVPTMQLQPLSEVALSLPAIVFNPESTVTIGRGADGAGKLPQTWLQVSSKHCAIRYNSEKGTWLIKDTSTNGSFVDGVRVGKGNEVPLKVGAVLRLSQAVGETKTKLIEFKFVEAPLDAKSPENSDKRPSPAEAADAPAVKRPRVESPVAQPKENGAPNDVQRVAQLHRSNEDLRKQLTEARERGDALKSELDATAKQRDEALASNKDLMEQKKRAAEELQAAVEGRDAAKEAAAGAAARAAAAAAAEDEAKRSAEDLRCQLEEAKAERTEIATAHAELKAEHKTVTAELDALRQKLSELEGQRDESMTGAAEKINELTQLCEDRSKAMHAAEAEAQAACRAADSVKERAEEAERALKEERARFTQLQRDLELQREQAAAAQEQACVRDSALEAVSADLAVGAAAARTAMEANAKLDAVLAELAAAKASMYSALLVVQSKQVAAVTAANFGKAPSDNGEDALPPGHGGWHTPGHGGSPAAGEFIATQAVSGFVSPAKSACAGSVRKITIAEASEEGKTGSQPSQRAGTTLASAGGGAGAERGAVTSPPPLPRKEAAPDQDETQAPPANDDDDDVMVLDEEPRQQPDGDEQAAAEQQDDGGVLDAAAANSDGAQQGDEEGDGQQQPLAGSQQGERSHEQEAGGSDADADEVAAGDDGAKEPDAEDSHPEGAAVMEEDAAMLPRVGDGSHPAADAADDVGRSSPSDPLDDDVRNSESNGYHFAAEGQAQADTLIAPSATVASMGNSLDGMS